MRVPNSVHLAHPWLIARIAPELDLLDVWAIPAEGARDEFSSLIDAVASFDPAEAASAPVRVLFAVRERLGGWLGWDDTAKPRPIPGSTETSLSARLPDDLRGTAAAAPISEALRGAGFRPLYRTDDEWAGEISNDTVHGVLHLAWVEQPDGRYRGRLSVYVKPRGKLGELYLKLIAPFRHLIVYPALLRQIGRAWDTRAEPSR